MLKPINTKLPAREVVLYSLPAGVDVRKFVARVVATKESLSKRYLWQQGILTGRMHTVYLTRHGWLLLKLNHDKSSMLPPFQIGVADIEVLYESDLLEGEG